MSQALFHSFHLAKRTNISITEKRKHLVHSSHAKRIYHTDQNKTYLAYFQKSLDYAWQYARDERGLFQTDWSGADKNEKKWLLTQAAFVEMYGRLAGINL